jgi:hypothetical protein
MAAKLVIPTQKITIPRSESCITTSLGPSGELWNIRMCVPLLFSPPGQYRVKIVYTLCTYPVVNLTPMTNSQDEMFGCTDSLPVMLPFYVLSNICGKL